MREIKFRAWDKDYKKMITNFLLPESKSFGMHRMAISFTGEVFTFTDWDMAEYDEDEMYNSAKYPSRFELMQYTGLKDKNGKEIYEGDICRDGLDWVFKVIWDSDNARFLGQQKKPRGDTYICYIGRIPAVEIIGNIHENPELLND